MPADGELIQKYIGECVQIFTCCDTRNNKRDNVIQDLICQFVINLNITKSNVYCSEVKIIFFSLVFIDFGYY